MTAILDHFIEQTTIRCMLLGLLSRMHTLYNPGGVYAHDIYIFFPLKVTLMIFDSTSHSHAEQLLVHSTSMLHVS